MSRKREPYRERRGWVILSGYAGRAFVGVTVIGETPARYRVRNDSDVDVRLAGRGRDRILAPGETRLVPRHAVAFDHL